MHSYAKTVLTVSFLLISFGLWAQETDHRTDSDLLARLSYQSPSVMHDANVLHICVAISREGDYRMVRSMDDGQTLRLHGRMSKEELQTLTKMVGAAEFRALSGNHGGLIRQDAERFGAEIPAPMQQRTDGTRKWLEPDVWRLQWLNADGESPFPSSVAKVVDWLRQFRPKNGRPFQYAEFPDVCPSSGVRLLQPIVAGNQGP